MMTSPADRISDLFYYLAEDDMAQLMSYFRFRHLPKGEILWREGEPSEFIAFVVSGKLEARKETEFKGKQVIIGVISDGSIVGDAAILDRRPVGATVLAMQDSALLCIAADDFDRLLEEQPILGMKLLKSMMLIMSTRMRHMAGRLAAIF
ncbi:hypothetical protein B5V00_01960 [Geothermobacter hydrogeniphilus]|uniref:Cyclic nucleotide-binding domain-containing protein n=2 Tax=Geothermobacter hydrogeniphilus TaxID=1969733 RepID=A0A1X0YCJ4_9BACT|nr:hypothetical protein B5V00_01960 [Geothermobacter hydrogeniphilus]